MARLKTRLIPLTGEVGAETGTRPQLVVNGLWERGLFPRPLMFWHVAAVFSFVRCNAQSQKSRLRWAWVRAPVLAQIHVSAYYGCHVNHYKSIEGATWVVMRAFWRPNGASVRRLIRRAPLAPPQYGSCVQRYLACRCGMKTDSLSSPGLPLLRVLSWLWSLSKTFVKIFIKIRAPSPERDRALTCSDGASRVVTAPTGYTPMPVPTYPPPRHSTVQVVSTPPLPSVWLHRSSSYTYECCSWFVALVTLFCWDDACFHRPP